MNNEIITCSHPRVKELQNQIIFYLLNVNPVGVSALDVVKAAVKSDGLETARHIERQSGVSSLMWVFEEAFKEAGYDVSLDPLDDPTS